MKPAKAHRKKLKAIASEAEPEVEVEGAACPTPAPSASPEKGNSQTHHCNAMATKQLHSNAMETKQFHSNAIETKQRHSSAVETKQLQSNAMETKQLQSNAMETKQLQSNAMETKQLQSNSKETKQLQSNAMETKQLHSKAMETKQLQSNAKETKRLQSNSKETKQLRSNTMESKQLHSNAKETKQLQSNAKETKQLQSDSMETKQLQSNAKETKQLQSNTILTKQLQSKALESKQLHSNAMETKQLQSNTIETKQLQSDSMETKPPNCSTLETKPLNCSPVDNEPPHGSARDTDGLATAEGDCSSCDGGVRNNGNSPTAGNSPTHSGSVDEDSLSEYDNVGSEEEEEEERDYDEDEELCTDADGMTYYVHCCPEDESYMEGMDCHEGGEAGEGPSTARAPDKSISSNSSNSSSKPTPNWIPSEGFYQVLQQDTETLVYKHPEPLTDPTFIQAPMAEDEEDEEEEEADEEEEEEEDDYFPYEGEEAEEDQHGVLHPQDGRDRGGRLEERGEAEEEEEAERCCGEREERGSPYRGDQSIPEDCRAYTHTPPCTHTPPYTHTPPCTHSPACSDTPPYGSYTGDSEEEDEEEEDDEAHPARRIREERRGVGRGSSTRTQSAGEARGRDGRHQNGLRGTERRRGSEDSRCHVERLSHSPHHSSELEDCEAPEGHPYPGHGDGGQGQGQGNRPYPGHRDTEQRAWHTQGHDPRSEVTVDLADEVRRSLSMGRHISSVERSRDHREPPDRPRGRSHHPRPVSLPLVLPDDLERASADLHSQSTEERRRSAHAIPAHASPERHPEPNRTQRNHRAPQQAKKNTSFPSFVEVPGPCEPEDLIDGIIFAANYLGSTQLLSDRNPSKSVRMMQAQEALDQVKSSNEDGPGLTEVDLFISTKAIKVLNADTQDTIMDNALRTISYIADIGSVVVLMARRRMSHSASLDCTDTTGAAADSRKQYRMLCFVFESEDAQLIAQSIGQAFSMAYQEFLRSNGINPKDLSQKDYSDIINTQEMYNDDLIHFSNSENCKELHVEKLKGEILGVVIVESGWGSILPTVILACMLNSGAAARSGKLSVGDQIMAVNDTSLVGLPLATCQSIIKALKNQVQVKLSVVSCPPVTTVLIKRPDLQYQLGFSVQNGIICSLMRGGIAERGGVRVGHRIIEINGQSVVAMAHEKIVHALSVSVGEINMRTMPAVMFRLLTGQETPVYI
ncbi:amyloid-beta A4 precursor protein-binding family A member 2 [Clupea harengus]|uniref:Amyloid-beta A4 precursor protein-binding family A member 3 n=1 Tax=Clupea harengus TaxID=7950 RepID=A0A6P8EWD0_CLUHA|nr:amyloid-beta A4 precursor protein-binding family A member 2 [Clupea harengus]